MSILGRFDPAARAVINPTDIVGPVQGMPSIAVSTFAAPVVNAWREADGSVEIARSITAGGPVPIYRTVYNGVEVAYYLSPVGAPAAAALMEEVIAMGVRNFVYFGSCGVLDARMAEGHFVVPGAALRDEGTSFFYLPAAEEVVLEPGSVARVAATFERLGLPFTLAKTWTTDGIYRETAAAVAARKASGCAVVEMECAALAAVAQFRGVRFAQFLFAEDNLDGDNWQPRTLHEHGASNAQRYMAAALECAGAFV